MPAYCSIFLRTGFYIFFLALLAGLYFLVTWSPAYSLTVAAGTVATAVIVACCCYEVYSASAFTKKEKVFWIAAFLMLPVIASGIYYVGARKNVTASF